MSEQATSLSQENIAVSQLKAAEEPIPGPANDTVLDDRKKGAARRIKELRGQIKTLQRQNEVLFRENEALRAEHLALRRQADESESLRSQLVTLEEREAEWQRLAIENAAVQEQAEKQKQIDAGQQRFAAWKHLIARSRHLAATSDYDSVVAKSDHFFSTALLEQILQFELGPQIAYRLARNSKLCQQLSQSPLTASALALVRIESEIQQELVKKNAEETFLKVKGGWSA